MDARQLELFLAVLESPTMTKAAERVHLSTAAVSVQMHALAAELKTDLFIRSGKKLMPTPAARFLEERARRVVAEFRSISASFNDNNALEDSRPYHFATGATALIYRLARPLRLLRSKFPKLDLRIHVMATEEMAAGVLNGQFDLGLISLPFSHPQLKIEPLFEEELLVVRHSARTGSGARIAEIKPRELDNAPMVLYPPSSNMRTIIDRFFAELNVTPRVIMEAADTEVIKCMVETGFGYSVLPKYALVNSKGYFQTYRIRGHRLFREQALVAFQTTHERPLTTAVLHFLKGQMDEIETRAEDGL